MKNIFNKKLIGGLAYVLAVFLMPYTITSVWQGNIKSEAVDNPDGRTVFLAGEQETEISLNEYLIGVIAGQIDASFETEAIKAQAILTRSFVCQVMGDEKTAGEEELRLDYLDTEELKIMWEGNYEEYYEKFSTAVKETDGQIMTYDGCVAEGVYHEVCAGATRDGTQVYPYLVSVESPNDIEAENYMTIKEYSFEEFMQTAALLEEGAVFSDGEAISLQIVETDAAGYVKSAMIGAKTFEGERIMEVFGLPSCAFTFQILENKIRIICYGKGYGYGMSQYGASRLAGEGCNAEYILKYYFSGIEIANWE